MGQPTVDRCVCVDLPFAEAIRLHRDGLSLKQIQNHTGCGMCCGLCVPYLREALRSGRDRLPYTRPMRSTAPDAQKAS